MFDLENKEFKELTKHLLIKMKLTNIEFDLNWPRSIELKNLRKYILNNISERGEVIRWSINNIKLNQIQEKILTISAVIIN